MEGRPGENGTMGKTKQLPLLEGEEEKGRLLPQSPAPGECKGVSRGKRELRICPRPGHQAGGGERSTIGARSSRPPPLTRALPLPVLHAPFLSARAPGTPREKRREGLDLCSVLPLEASAGPQNEGWPRRRG